MRVAFLGTGAATSRDRFNSSVALDDRLVLDAGAPLLVNLSRVGIDPDGIRYVLLSHCHGDHFLGLGTFLIGRVLDRGPSLVLVGPPETEQRADALCRALWGDGWRTMGHGGFDLKHVRVEAGVRVELDPYRVEVLEIQHDSGTYDAVQSVGYVIDDGEVRLGFTGDAAPGPWVDRLLECCDAAIVECTGMDPGPTHLSHRYVGELVRRHPETRVIITHLGSERPPFAGVLAAEDLTSIDVQSVLTTPATAACWGKPQ
jgi:ribonuclease BN (tRNA processing enzyme)